MEIPARPARCTARSNVRHAHGNILGGAKDLHALGEDLGAGLTQAELQYLVTHEWAYTAEDVLWRRTKLGLHLKHRERAKVERSLDALLGCANQPSARSAG